MYLIEVQLELYIFYPKAIQQISLVCHIQRQSFRPALGLCCVCVSCSQYLLLPLTIVSECAGKLTAYLCRAAEGPTSGIRAIQAPSPDQPLAMTDGSEMGDSSGAAVATQPRQEVVVRTVQGVSGTSWTTLTRTNYDEWMVTMKIKLRARRL